MAKIDSPSIIPVPKNWEGVIFGTYIGTLSIIFIILHFNISGPGKSSMILGNLQTQISISLAMQPR